MLVYELKEYLLGLDFLIDNDYLDKYVDLVIRNQFTAYIKNSTNKHHIVPKYYYCYNNLRVNNDNTNLINLLYRDHILAHYYLAMCSKYDFGKRANIFSISFLLNGKKLEDLNIEEIDFHYYQQLYETGRKYVELASHSVEANKKVSNKLLGRVSPNKGNITKLEKKSKANPNAKNKKLSEHASNRIGKKNPFYGKKHSDEFKDFISRKNGKAVVMIDIEAKQVLREFQSAGKAGLYLYENNMVQTKCAAQRILDVCHEDNYKYNAYGYNWKFISKV